MPVLVKDILTREVITVPRQMEARDAALILIAHKISGAPVVDTDNTLVGVISDSDLVRNSARSLYRQRAISPYFTSHELQTLEQLRAGLSSADESVRVEELMTPYAISTTEDADIKKVARIMVEEKVHRVLVLKEGKLTGIVSTMDVVRAVARHGIETGRRKARPSLATPAAGKKPKSR